LNRQANETAAEKTHYEQLRLSHVEVVLEHFEQHVVALLRLSEPLGIAQPDLSCLGQYFVEFSLKLLFLLVFPSGVNLPVHVVRAHVVLL
jgi:hypothetical protein